MFHYYAKSFQLPLMLVFFLISVASHLHMQHGVVLHFQSNKNQITTKEPIYRIDCFMFLRSVSTIKAMDEWLSTLIQFL